MTTQTESIARRAAKDINKGYDIKARIEMAIKEALVQPEQQPVAWHVYFGNEDEPNYVCIGEKPIEARAVIRPLVFGDTTPPQRKPLTNEQIMEMVFAECDNMRWPSTALYIARAIEASHGIKD